MYTHARYNPHQRPKTPSSYRDFTPSFAALCLLLILFACPVEIMKLEGCDAGIEVDTEVERGEGTTLTVLPPSTTSLSSWKN